MLTEPRASMPITPPPPQADPAPDFQPDAKGIYLASGALVFAWDWADQLAGAAARDDRERANEALWRLTEALAAVRMFVLGLAREFKAARPQRCVWRGRSFSSAHLAMLESLCRFHDEVSAACHPAAPSRGRSANGPDWASLPENWDRVVRAIGDFRWSKDEAVDLRRRVQQEASLAILALDGVAPRRHAQHVADQPVYDIHARMVDMVLAEPACQDWTAYEFAQSLGCQPNTVKATGAWQEIMHSRIRAGSAE